MGSIVWLWVHDEFARGGGGRVNGSPLIVIPDGSLTQTALLPERAGGQEPGGDPAPAWGNEFVLVAQGHGKLPTHGTATRKVEEWLRGRP